jgi:hypothetical protein
MVVIIGKQIAPWCPDYAEIAAVCNRPEVVEEIIGRLRAADKRIGKPVRRVH